GGWPEPLRSTALAGRPASRPTVPLTDDEDAALDEAGRRRQRTLNRLLFPEPTRQFEEHRDRHGDTSRLSSNQFFYGLRHGDEHRVQLAPGVELLIGLEAIGDPDEQGYRSVMCVLNGQLRPVQVRDRSVGVDVPSVEKAEPGNDLHVAAPFSGVVSVAVEIGDELDPGATVASIEAMKMEADITTPRGGIVSRVAIAGATQVEAGDLILVLEE
ncbi:MAG: biotin/lipoyl-containing protein, partial [Dietzia sp.]|uniref:biotin/lipoyl-containing protein n=1 Tax=Dietzia sp. TaxID=1871616 RepID=UPI002717F0B4